MDHIIGFIKSNRILVICISVITIIIAIGSGYWCGYTAGYTSGWDKGTAYGEYNGYEEGYSAGFSKGKEYGIANIDKYANIIKPVTFDMLAKFIKEDQTDEIKASDQFDCGHFASTLKENANKRGIKCAYVYIGTRNGAHAVNAFDTTDKGVIFLEPQFDIFIGEKSNLDGYVIDYMNPIPRVQLYQDYDTNTKWYSMRSPYPNADSLSYLYGITELELVW